jgi:hypothetical protein
MGFKKIYKFIGWVILPFIFFCFGCSKMSNDVEVPITPIAPEFTVVEYAPVAVNKSNKTPIFAHYMPWFESPEYAQFGNAAFGNWGSHWTMSNKNPTIIDALTGQRQIASYFYPLIGPYDNGEPDYLEYAVSIMKLSGIDGVMIATPCVTNVNDSKLLHEHTEAILPWLSKAGLKFSIVYEDVVLKLALEQKLITNLTTEGKRVLNFMNQNYFSRDNYFKIGNQPVLLNFGPQSLLSDKEWNDVFADMAIKPLFVPLQYNIAGRNLTSSASGEFCWGTTALLESFYQNSSKYKVTIGGAIPGFKDYYQQGGWGNGYTSIDFLNGDRFLQTLQFANTHKVDAIQLITWNDFGEGTVIEPTKEFGYKYLNQLQSFLGLSNPTNDLAIAVELYQNRKKYKGNDLVNKKLDQVFYYIVSLQLDKARILLNSV